MQNVPPKIDEKFSLLNSTTAKWFGFYYKIFANKNKNEPNKFISVTFWKKYRNNSGNKCNLQWLKIALNFPLINIVECSSKR